MKSPPGLKDGNRGEAALTLHHFTSGAHSCRPVLEHIRKAFSVFGHPAEKLERDLGKNAEGALAAHHDLIEVRSVASLG